MSAIYQVYAMQNLGWVWLVPVTYPLYLVIYMVNTMYPGIYLLYIRYQVHTRYIFWHWYIPGIYLVYIRYILPTTIKVYTWYIPGINKVYFNAIFFQGIFKAHIWPSCRNQWTMIVRTSLHCLKNLQILAFIQGPIPGAEAREKGLILKADTAILQAFSASEMKLYTYARNQV